jgi:hypothetical protein
MQEMAPARSGALHAGHSVGALSVAAGTGVRGEGGGAGRDFGTGMETEEEDGFFGAPAAATTGGTVERGGAGAAAAGGGAAGRGGAAAAAATGWRAGAGMGPTVNGF